jgi:hypothetical protein
MMRTCWLAVVTLLAATVAGCSSSNQIIVRNDAEPYNFQAAQLAADQGCAARGGGTAQLVRVLNNARSTGGGHVPTYGPPDIIYRCMPS